MKQSIRAVGVNGIYVRAQIATAPKMSVSYVLLMMCVIILGSAWHGPSGEAGVKLMDQERGGSWLVHELKHAETSLILVN